MKALFRTRYLQGEENGLLALALRIFVPKRPLQFWESALMENNSLGGKQSRVREFETMALGINVMVTTICIFLHSSQLNITSGEKTCHKVEFVIGCI